MNWLTSIFSGGTQGIISGLGDVVDKFVTTGDEKNQMKLALEAIVTERMGQVANQANIEMEAKSKIIQAELNQGDKFTKRARPTVVYAGLFIIFYNYCIVPTVQLYLKTPIVPFELPSEFWYGWSGIVATWSVGRSMEKNGAQSNVVATITGNKSLLG